MQLIVFCVIAVLFHSFPVSQFDALYSPKVYNLLVPRLNSKKITQIFD